MSVASSVVGNAIKLSKGGAKAGSKVEKTRLPSLSSPGKKTKSLDRDDVEGAIQVLGLSIGDAEAQDYALTILGNAGVGFLFGGFLGALAGAMRGTAYVLLAEVITSLRDKAVDSHSKEESYVGNVEEVYPALGDRGSTIEKEYPVLSESGTAIEEEYPALGERGAAIEPKFMEDSIKSMAELEDESVKLEENLSDLSVSVGDKLNPKVKDLAESVKQLDEATNIQDQAAKYIYGQFGLDESGMPLGGLPKREDFLVGGQMLSVTESEKEGIEGIQGGIKEQIGVLNNVADGLDMVGYDLKGVGNFATTIEQLTLASKLDHPDFDKTKAYVAGISSLFKGIGANIGGNVGSALSSMGNMAASGASIGSAIAPGGTGAVVGAVVGGAVGLISSIFGGDDEDEQEEAARERMRQQIYQGMLSRSLSGSGPYSLKMLRESNWDYDKLKKQFGKKDEEELIKYQNRLELLDDIGASLEQIGSPEIVRSIDQVRAKYEYAAKSVKGMLDIASAEMTEISAQVFGLTADNLVSMFDSAIETAEDAGHAGRLIAEALELQIVDSFKKLAISQAINEAVMPMLQPILNELVAGALSGGLSPGEMADLVLQAQEIAASVAPAVSSLYGAFDEAGVLNYSYSSPPFESQGSYNGPVITGGTGFASGQQNDTRGDRPVQVVVQVANHEFETMVTELADNVFVRAERRKGVVNAQKVFG